MITTRAKIIIVVGSTVFLVLGLLWESWSIYITFKTQPTFEQEEGVADLQSAVTIWKEKKQFTLEGVLKAPVASNEAKEEDNTQNVTYTVQIRDASGSGQSASISSLLSSMPGVVLVETTTVESKSETEIARKTTVPAAIVNALDELLKSKAAVVSKTTLSREAPVDIVITLGNE